MAEEHKVAPVREVRPALCDLDDWREAVGEKDRKNKGHEDGLEPCAREGRVKWRPRDISRMLVRLDWRGRLAGEPRGRREWKDLNSQYSAAEPCE